jgi:hypothetical protein
VSIQLAFVRNQSDGCHHRNGGKEKTMASFTIDSENNIIGYASGEAIPENASERFAAESELGQLAAQWPAARLVEVWNSLPGLAPVRKFTNRKTAVARIWKAAQSLVSGANTPDVPTKRAKSRKRPTSKAKGHTARDGSKKADIIGLLERAKGATLEELMEATGWQAHSVRGFISGTLGKKLKLKVESFKTDKGDRTYRLKG